MSAGRTIFNLASVVTPISYLTLAMDGKGVEALALWSSITLTIWGGIIIATYDGPPGSAIGNTLFGKPPVWPRVCVLCYGFLAAILLFRALGLTQFMR